LWDAHLRFLRRRDWGCYHNGEGTITIIPIPRPFRKACWPPNFIRGRVARPLKSSIAALEISDFRWFMPHSLARAREMQPHLAPSMLHILPALQHTEITVFSG
jgi:hypothetical protein